MALPTIFEHDQMVKMTIQGQPAGNTYQVIFVDYNPQRCPICRHPDCFKYDIADGPSSRTARGCELVATDQPINAPVCKPIAELAIGEHTSRIRPRSGLTIHATRIADQEWRVTATETATGQVADPGLRRNFATPAEAAQYANQLQVTYK